MIASLVIVARRAPRRAHALASNPLPGHWSDSAGWLSLPSSPKPLRSLTATYIYDFLPLSSSLSFPLSRTHAQLAKRRSVSAEIEKMRPKKRRTRPWFAWPKFSGNCSVYIYICFPAVLRKASCWGTGLESPAASRSCISKLRFNHFVQAHVKHATTRSSSIFSPKLRPHKNNEIDSIIPFFFLR